MPTIPLLPAPALLLLVAACGDTAHEAAPENRQEPSAFTVPARTAPAPLATNAPDRPEPRPGAKLSGDAASAARMAQAYFDLLEAGDYARAWRLRWESRKASLAQAEAFVAAFARYRSYRATVGRPSQEVRVGDSLFVEIPVQIYGQLAGGAPLASAGIITLRRDAASPGDWRIYSR